MTAGPRAATRRPAVAARPTIVDLLNAPELAVLDVLAHAARLARLALVVQHPHLLGHDRASRGDDGDPVARCAVELHDCALDLSAALRHYRRALKDATTLGDDDFPF